MSHKSNRFNSSLFLSLVFFFFPVWVYSHNKCTWEVRWKLEKACKSLSLLTSCLGPLLFGKLQKNPASFLIQIIKLLIQLIQILYFLHCFHFETSVIEGTVNVLLATFNKTLMVYQDVALAWAAQLPHIPVAVRVASFQ